jgi:hypothetical protein
MDISEKFCQSLDLTTYDPYDVWKTGLGFQAKNFYNVHKWLGLFPAATLTLYDFFVNNHKRRFYTPQEYPVVRAWAALILLNHFKDSHRNEYLFYAREHLEWLKLHSCHGYRGCCWGVHFVFVDRLNLPKRLDESC